MRNSTILVIGGGPCGCSAAWEASRLGLKTILVEERPVLGGLAAGNRLGGNIYEYGTHVFHTHLPGLLAKIKRLMGPELLEIDRGSNLHIKFSGRYFVYPLQGIDLIRNLPAGLGIRAGLSFCKAVLLHDILKRGGAPQNTEEYLIRSFGNVLYNSFFKNYSEKVWGLPLSQMDPVFGQQRIPRSDILSVLKKLLDSLGLSRVFRAHELSESVIGNIYYTKTGVGRIFERMAEELKNAGGQVLTSHRLKQLVVEDGVIKAAVFNTMDGETTIEASRFIVTIPLPVLAQTFCGDVPLQAVDGGLKLRYRSLSVVGLLVNKPQVRTSFLTYFKDAHFNRLSEPSNHGLVTSPEGHSLLLAETICAPDSNAYNGNEDHIRAVIDDLVSEDLLKPEQIVDTRHFAWRHAYPLYDLGFQRNLENFRSYLNSLSNLISTGRQGNFSYVNMHLAMDMGFKAAQAVGSFV